METILNGLRKDMGKGGAGLVQAGDDPGLFSYLQVLGSIAGPAVANTTTLAAMAAKDLADGMVVIDKATGYRWRYSADSTATDATKQLAVAVTAGGAFLRNAEKVALKLAISKDTADAAAIFTVPTGFKLAVQRTFWEVGTGFTGGAASAIGLSSSNAAYNTKGDILGGAAGDVTATLGTAGYKAGTLGAKFGSNGIVILVGGDTIRFDRITSAYTAGAGFAHILADVIS